MDARSEIRELLTSETRKDHARTRGAFLSYNRIDVAADPGLMIVTYTAEPGSRSAEALRLLASWAATAEDDVGSADREADARHRSRAE